MKINVVDKTAEYENIIGLQKALIFQLRAVGQQRAEKIKDHQYCLAQNYEKGWKDAVKKISNFIERHCKEYE